jgi:hypothetical protein
MRLHSHTIKNKPSPQTHTKIKTSFTLKQGPTTNNKLHETNVLQQIPHKIPYLRPYLKTLLKVYLDPT